MTDQTTPTSKELDRLLDTHGHAYHRLHYRYSSGIAGVEKQARAAIHEHVNRLRSESAAPTRKFTGIGYLEETGYIPAGSAAEREAAPTAPAEPPPQEQQPVAWICKDDLARLRKHGDATVYAVFQEYRLTPEIEQFPLFKGPAEPTRSQS